MDELKATGHCPICRCEIPQLALAADGAPPPDAARQCLRCMTWYHQDCWDYGGGCAIFGCEPHAPARPCPPPRPTGPLWERVSRAGVALALGTVMFLVGGLLGLVGWGAAGPLALPVILLLGWCAEDREGQVGSKVLRRGLLFGPLAFLVLPYPVFYLALIPLGVAIAGLGQLLRFAGIYPRTAFALAVAGTGALSYSHAPAINPVAYSLDRSVPEWALSRRDLGTRPRLIQGADLARAWRSALHAEASRGATTPLACRFCDVTRRAWDANNGARPDSRELLDQLLAMPDDPPGCAVARRLPDDCRVLVFPRGAVNVEVSRGKGRLRVLTGPTAWKLVVDALTYSTSSYRSLERRDPVALVLPPGTEPVAVLEREIFSELMGPRADELLRPSGTPAVAWGERPFWPYRPRGAVRNDPVPR